MRTLISGAAVLVLAVSVLAKAGIMTRNEKYLEEARGRAKAFEVEQEPERLREAYLALENVALETEHDPKIRTRMRSECLVEWLSLLQLLDRFLDPNFDPREVPSKLVQPPPTKSGVMYPPGADPALIDDPKARAEYEKAVQANRARIERYRVQVHLNRLKEDLPQRAIAFIRSSYTSSQRDQEEVRNAVNKIIKNPGRKAGLLDLLHSRPSNGSAGAPNAPARCE